MSHVHSVSPFGMRPLLALVLMAGLSVFGAHKTMAGTIIDQHITTNTTWTKAGSPYEVTYGIYVREGATLTIQPGVEVRFRENEFLWVNGTIKALGTAAERIVFTGTSASPGWWQAIGIEGTGSEVLTGSVLDYVTLEYGGGYWGGLYLSQAAVIVKNCIFRYNNSNGIYSVSSAAADISDTSFLQNQGSAVNFVDARGNSVLARLTASGNGFNGIRLGDGYLGGTHTWENAGLPYRVDGWIVVEENSCLKVEPGVTVRFAQNASLWAYGTIQAIGTAAQPITFTGTSATPGWWQGVGVEGSGGSSNRGSIFDFTTIEYAGSYYGNLYLYDAQVIVRHSILRHSSTDGLYASHDVGTLVETSQIVQNAGYGIQNISEGPILAMNNWWGDPSGPTQAQCNSNGKGSRVSSGVAFRPFLTSPTRVPGPVDPSDTTLLTIAPLRWYAPADGITRVWVKVGLHDGHGLPLPGRIVTLNSSLGQVTSGGITDFQGQTFAYLTSSTPGDALLTPGLSGETLCEIPRAATAKVTFTTTADDPLLPGAQAPYMHEGIEVTPLPVTRGVLTHLKATLSNPNDFPILVDASFNFAQLGIGLAFGPVGQVQDVRIEAGAARTIDIPWTPIVSGNYCVQLQYTARQADSALRGPGWSASGSSMSNLSVQSGPLGSSSSTPGDPNALPSDPNSQEKPGEKPTIEKAKNSIGAIRGGRFVQRLVTKPADVSGFAIPNYLFSKILDFNFDTWAKASEALGGDPPRQDYTTIALAPKIPFTPVQAGGDMTAGRASAANALMEAAMEMTAKYRAAQLSLERYSGAAEAQNLAWASQQAAALVYYKKESGKAMLTVADRLAALVQQIQSEGITDMTVTSAVLQTYQDRLRTQGWTAEEKQAAYSVGLTDEDLAVFLQEHLAGDPNQMAGSVLASLSNLAATLRELGAVLMNPGNFPPSGGGLAQSTPNNLVRIFSARARIQVRNPLGNTAAVELRIRPVNLPPDWMVNVSPSKATLASGQTITAEVQFTPGMAAVQGLQPRAAVEAFADNTLIGGVVVDVLVPQAVYFDGQLRLYLPLILK
jgi:hypothetical protein